ncbi:MAG: 3-oxoacyl-ACP synthase III family protein [Prevotella sp.]
MAFLKVEKVAIRGISGCVPSQVEENISLPFYSSKEEAEQVIAATGIERRHITSPSTTATDLCFAAAEELIKALGWAKESVDLIAFATQCPDYVNHPNSFIVHDKMGLSENTICIDYYHGCPAWVISLSSVMMMMQSGMIKRAILLDGDTVSQIQDKQNREERPLFGDAGTATALEYDESASEIYFNIGTKSEDGKALIKEDGGFRNPYTMESLHFELEKRAGNISPEQVSNKMDSMDVFSFAITKVPKALKKLCSEYGINMDDITNLYLHQANKLILANIAKRMKVSMDKVPMSLRDYGNTTSASIPLTIIVNNEGKADVNERILACGFGTGLAWGAVYFETRNMICPKIIEI